MSELIESNVYGFVYKVTNKTNGKVYVGQHMGTGLGDYWGSGLILNKAYKRHGYENFKREIVEYAGNKKELDFLERYYIQQLGSLVPNGYNIATGGRGGYTGPATPEISEKIRRKLKGRHHTEEARSNMSKAKKGKPGHPHSEEEKRKISQAHIGIEPWNKGKGRPVEQLTLDGKHVHTWATAAEAIQGGFKSPGICECIHGKSKHYKRFLWRYL